MEKVTISVYLEDKLKNLITILYEKEYFGFLESSEKYVDKIIDFIYTIPSQPIRTCINPKYGKYYAVFKMNENTTYYKTYDFEHEFYLIKNIFNNHEEEYPIYIQ